MRVARTKSAHDDASEFLKDIFRTRFPQPNSRGVRTELLESDATVYSLPRAAVPQSISAMRRRISAAQARSASASAGPSRLATRPSA